MCISCDTGILGSDGANMDQSFKITGFKIPWGPNKYLQFNIEMTSVIILTQCVILKMKHQRKWIVAHANSKIEVRRNWSKFSEFNLTYIVIRNRLLKEFKFVNPMTVSFVYFLMFFMELTELMSH